MGTAAKRQVLTKEAAIEAVISGGNKLDIGAGGPDMCGVNWTLHDSHMRTIGTQENGACFYDLPRQIRDLIKKDIRYVNYNVYFKGNNVITREDCIAYIEWAIKNRCMIGTDQSGNDILENGYIIDLLNPDVTVDRLYASLCTLRNFSEHRRFVKAMLLLCEAGWDYWIAYCLCHELTIGDNGHSWYPVCSGYSSIGFGKLDVWQVKYVRDYFLLNKGKPKFPHAYTKLLRGDTFTWHVATTVKSPDGRTLPVGDYKKFLDDMVQYVIKEPVDFDTAKTLIKGDVKDAKKSKKTKVVDEDDNEEFRVA